MWWCVYSHVYPHMYPCAYTLWWRVLRYVYKHVYPYAYTSQTLSPLMLYQEFDGYICVMTCAKVRVSTCISVCLYITNPIVSDIVSSVWGIYMWWRVLSHMYPHIHIRVPIYHKPNRLWYCIEGLMDIYTQWRVLSYVYQHVNPCAYISPTRWCTDAAV